MNVWLTWIPGFVLSSSSFICYSSFKRWKVNTTHAITWKTTHRKTWTSAKSKGSFVDEVIDVNVCRLAMMILSTFTTSKNMNMGLQKPCNSEFWISSFLRREPYLLSLATECCGRTRPKIQTYIIVLVEPLESSSCFIWFFCLSVSLLIDFMIFYVYPSLSFSFKLHIF